MRYKTHDEILANEGTTAAPASRRGKLRCPLCLEWVADNAEDRRFHARQERLLMGGLRGRGPVWARNA